MFFATTAQPLIRRQAYAQSGRALERFMDEALRSTSNRSCAYTQDDAAFMLSLDMPGIAKDQLSIAVEGAVVTIASKQGASRKYNVAYELPQEIDTSLSEARLENGVLNLKLAKKIPASNAIELTIH